MIEILCNFGINYRCITTLSAGMSEKKLGNEINVQMHFWWNWPKTNRSDDARNEIIHARFDVFYVLKWITYYIPCDIVYYCSLSLEKKTMLKINIAFLIIHITVDLVMEKKTWQIWMQNTKLYFLVQCH